jgi:hypothetical protein
MTSKTRARRGLIAPILAATIAGALTLTACANDPGSQEADGQDSGRRGRGAYDSPHGGSHIARLPNVFISPAGKPFRARPGEPYPVALWFAEADADHDGRLSQTEMRSDADTFFRSLDTNHDGVIDGAEVQNYEQNIAPDILPHIENLHEGEGFDPNVDLADQRNSERPGQSGQGRRSVQSGQPRAPKGETTTQGAAVYSLINQPEPVAGADSDFDGKITLAEFRAAADRHFEILDTKGQGYLTLIGLPKTPIQLAIEQAAKRRADQKTGGAMPIDKPVF